MNLKTPLLAWLVIALTFLFVSSGYAQVIDPHRARPTLPQPTVALVDSAAIALAKRAHAAYLIQDAAVYRNAIFETFLRIRDGAVRENLSLLSAFANEARTNGTDGLEPVLIGATYDIAERGDAAALAKLRGLLSGLHAAHHYASATPHPNILIPFTVRSSPLALDVRGDAMRVLFEQMLAQTLAQDAVRSLLDLLSSATTRDALCTLPPQRDQFGNEAPADQSRQENCQANSQPGESGSGTVSGTLGDLSGSGCMLGKVQDFIDTFNRLRAMDACLNSIGVADPRARYSDGGIISGAITAAVILVAEYVYVEWRDRQKEISDAAKVAIAENRAASSALQDFYDARADFDDAQRAYDDAARDVVRREEELDAARQSGDQKQIDKAEKALAEAKAEADKKKKELEDKLKAKDEADKKAKQAEDKAKQAKDDYDDKVKKSGLEPGDAFSTPACREAMGDPNNRLLRDKLAHDWTDWKSRLRRVSRPNPATDDNPFQALALPVCGADLPTTNTPQQRCNSPVLCTDGWPDSSCGCRGAASDETRLIRSMSIRACSAVRCSNDGTTSPSLRGGGTGTMCQCEPVDRPLTPVSPRPPPTVVATFFGTKTALATPANESSMAVVRSLFGSEPAHTAPPAQPR